MSSSTKRLIRHHFRHAVFERDGHKCRVCGWSLITIETPLDAHHITDRNLISNGGYVPENGISLCPTCHEKAEIFHSTGTAHVGYSPDDLYRLIGSSYDIALMMSERLK